MSAFQGVTLTLALCVVGVLSIDRLVGAHPHVGLVISFAWGAAVGVIVGWCTHGSRDV